MYLQDPCRVYTRWGDLHALGGPGTPSRILLCFLRLKLRLRKIEIYYNKTGYEIEIVWITVHTQLIITVLIIIEIVRAPPPIPESNRTAVG